MQPETPHVITTDHIAPTHRRISPLWYATAVALLLVAVGAAVLLATINNRRAAANRPAAQVLQLENDSQFDADDIDVPPPADAKTIKAPAMEVHDVSQH